MFVPVKNGKCRLFALLIVALTVPFLFSSVAFAEDVYPMKPVTVVVGTKPGGGIDNLARIVAAGIPQHLNGQPFVVVNKPGSSQLVAAKFVSKAKPDGYTLIKISSTAHIAAMVSDHGIDFLRDFEPVAQVAVANLVLLSHKDRNIKNPDELLKAINQAYADGQRLRYATAGRGSINHVAMMSWLLSNGVADKVQDIPFAGGAPTKAAILGNQVAFGILGLQHYNPNKDTVNAIGILADERDPVTPEVKTFKEQGSPSVSMPAGMFYLAPKGTPESVIRTLSAAIGKTLADPKVQEQARKANMVLVYRDCVGTRAELEKNQKEWLPVINEVKKSM